VVDLGLDIHAWALAAGPARRRDLLSRIADGGLGHVGVGDHIDFHGGAGFDGFVSATAAAVSEPRLDVVIGVYLLALRHPMTVARQLSSLSEVAPGRITLGVGLAGEDRKEVANCGVDPATRGRRTDEALDVLRRLGTGDQVDHDGEFFRIEGARVLPAPLPRVPVLVGGTAEQAMRRTVEHGDGWIGVFSSARRVGAVRARLAEIAAEVGKPAPDRTAIKVWCGFGEPAAAESRLAHQMESLYKIPYDSVRKVAPAGPPAQVAEFLLPCAEAGCTEITLIPSGESWEAVIDAAAEIRSRLDEAVGPSGTVGEVVRELPEAADTLWARLRDPAEVGWVDLIAKAEMDGRLRRFSLADGSSGAELITDHDDVARSYSYTYLEGGMPVRRYRATLDVTPNGAGSTVRWRGEVRASSPGLERKIVENLGGMFADGFATLAGEGPS
jgi:alkanesulfonate monooxygenase SsuD/methylene tetrahydromethanopterin reductase-like flavin-dependent oxidoreductase (luciferase family)